MTAPGAYPGTARLAYTLAGVSGYVDGVGATLLAGLFVSFMSGNTTSAGLAKVSLGARVPTITAVPIHETAPPLL